MVSGILKNIKNWVIFIAMLILLIVNNQMYIIYHNHAKNDAKDIINIA